MARLLGIDYGKKRIGLAVTDELQMIASPLEVLNYDAQFLPKLKAIVEKYAIEKIILGYPYSEKHPKQMLEVDEFSRRLVRELQIEVLLQNEEFTSVYMTSFLKSLGLNDKQIKAKIDKYAAQKILESYLSANKGDTSCK